MSKLSSNKGRFVSLHKPLRGGSSMLPLTFGMPWYRWAALRTIKANDNRRKK